MSLMISIERVVKQTDFAQRGGLNFTINDFVINGADVTSIRPNGVYILRLVSDVDKPFLGALIRVKQQQQETITVYFKNDTASPFNCTRCFIDLYSDDDDVVALMHTDNTPKSVMAGYLNTSSDDGITIDITVVDANDATNGSLFTYQKFSIGVVPSTPPPSTSPSLASPTVQTARPTSMRLCSICGIGNKVTNPTGTLLLNTVPVSCGAAEEESLLDPVPPEVCAALQTGALNGSCGCAPISDTTTTTVAPSILPTVAADAVLPPTSSPVLIDDVNSTIESSPLFNNDTTTAPSSSSGTLPTVPPMTILVAAKEPESEIVRNTSSAIIHSAPTRIAASTMLPFVVAGLLSS